MRIVDAQLAFPSLLLAIAVIAALGTSLWTLLAVLALRSWAVHARTLRSAVLVIREQESVTAARALGAGPMRVAFKEILPNALAPLIVVATAQLGALILLESTLSFLGIGLQPPAPSWGSMLSSGPAVHDRGLVGRRGARRGHPRSPCSAPICWATACETPSIPG